MHVAGARGLARLRRLTDNQKIMSSNLIGPTTLLNTIIFERVPNYSLLRRNFFRSLLHVCVNFYFFL